jgi:hypothetical protein
MIEGLDECVETFLLLQQRRSWRPRGLCLERSVHPFVAAILLGTRRFDLLELDAERHPPR